MLAGYLPFDDDPANPEGDNINLLYKYIVSTPLTFPEYVTPHARDLLRRILVPDPRKRADLFEVARHSWLSEYSHVVGFITSSTTTSVDIGNTTVPSEDPAEAPSLVRSASVREPSKTQKSTPAVGDLSRKHGNVDQEAEEHHKTAKDNKRRTVQVEYVAPRSQTQRGEPSSAPPSAAPAPRTRARAGSNGPVEVNQPSRSVSTQKPLPADPPRDGQYPTGRRGSTSQQRQGTMAPPTSRPREAPRAVSDAAYMAPPLSGQSSHARPNTGGSMTSNRSGSLGIPNRGSYSQPVAPTVAGTNAHGRMSQPKTGNNYNISAPIPQDDQTSEYGRPSQPLPSKFAKVAGVNEPSGPTEGKTHKRSNTIGGIFSRTNSIFGKSNQERQEKSKKSYPPVSYSSSAGPDEPRQSIDSRRSISFGFGKKRSGSIAGGSQTTLQDKPRRFSLLPASFSLKAIGIGKDTPPPSDGRPDSQGNYLDPPLSREARNVNMSTGNPRTADGSYDRNLDSPIPQDRRGMSSSPIQQRYPPQSAIQDPRSGNPPQLPPMNFRQNESTLTTESESSLGQNQRGGNQNISQFEDFRRPAPGKGRGVLQKNNRRFTDAYEQEPNNGYGPAHVDNAGSSGAARKVMDFFRRRGKARGDDR